MATYDASKIGILGPGRLGTAFALKFARDGKEVMIYYHDSSLCQEINSSGLNPKHLTDDLARILGDIDKVPRLSERVFATNDLEQVVMENAFIVLAVTMNKLPEMLDYLRPLLTRKRGMTCLISPIKGLASDEKTKELITPSQMIGSHLFDLAHKYELVVIGGPFFDIDMALGKPICLTVAGKKKIAKLVKEEFIDINWKELSSFYNFDMIGVEACGALKNVMANIKGVQDQLNLGNSIPGTLFARSGVEIRSLSKLLGGGFQAFYSQAGVGDLFVTLSSEASKNYRYGKYFYKSFTGNPIETDIRVHQQIDGTPEGPNTIKNVHRYLEKKNMYSPLFHCAYKIFNEAKSREEIENRIVQACQDDKRYREYIGPFSRLLYRIIPNLWYRRHKGILSRIDF